MPRAINRYAGQHSEEVLYGPLFPLTGSDIIALSIFQTPLFFGLDGVLAELVAEERQRPLAEPITTFLHPTPTLGSNAFAVGPARTTEGETFLAVNSHQPWTGPVAWYEAHLHSEEGWEMVGGLFPGSPLVTPWAQPPFGLGIYRQQP